MFEPVAITGVEMLCALGGAAAPIGENLMAGKHGLSPQPDSSPGEPSALCGRVTEALESELGTTGRRHHSQAARMACFTARRLLATTHAKPQTAAESETLGVVIGNMVNIFGGQYDMAMLRRDIRHMNPMAFLNLSANAVAAHMSVDTQARAFMLTVSTGCTAGLEAMAMASQALQLERAQLVLAGGAEALTPQMIYSLAHLDQEASGGEDGIFSTPAKQGVVAGEGCALVLLESRSRVPRQDRPVRAWIKGYGMSANPQPGEKPSAVIVCAAETALAMAGIEPSAIDVIWSAANGWDLQDEAEAQAWEELWPAALPPAVALKGALGEAWHASGAMAVAAAVWGLEQGVVWPTARLHAGGLAQRLNLSSQARSVRMRYALVLAREGTDKAAALVLGTQPGGEGS